MDEYVKSLKGYPELQDKLAAPSSESDGHHKTLFPEHFSPGKILSGIKTGKILQGTFYASRSVLIICFQTMITMIIILKNMN